MICKRRFMHILGIDHEKLTFKHQGRRFRIDRCTWEGGEGYFGVIYLFPDNIRCHPEPREGSIHNKKLF